jgi:MAP/microtubule affinity-regulating kinase
VFQIASALLYLHQRHITHRDIKLENVLLVTDECTTSIKLIDFGFSTLFHRDNRKKMFCGTPSYMAPEIVQKLSFRGPPVDLWALGVLAYFLLTSSFPFKAPSDKELYTKIIAAEFNETKLNDPLARDLITRLLCADPEKRIDAR